MKNGLWFGAVSEMQVQAICHNCNSIWVYYDNKTFVVSNLELLLFQNSAMHLEQFFKGALFLSNFTISLI